MRERMFGLRSVAAGACVMALAALEAHAGGVTNANITQLQPLSPSELFVYVDATPSGTPACGTLTTASRRYVVDLTTEAGKVMAAAFLTAYSLKSLVDISGTNSCAIWADTETVYFMTAH